MFCPNCGAKNADDSAFCQNCGTSLHEEEATVREEFEATPSAAETVSSAPAAICPNDSIRTFLKLLGSSPLFLTAAVSYTVSVFFSIVSSVIGINFGMLAYQLYKLADEFGIDRSYVHSFFDGMRTGSVIGAVSGAIPTILFAIGLWLIYASCSDRYDPYIKTSGLTLIKVLQILKLIGVCLTTFFVLAVLLVLVFASNAYFSAAEIAEGSVFVVIFGVLTVLVTLMLALSIVYNALALHTVNRIKKTALNGAFCGYASGFVGVMLILGSLFTFMGSIPTFVFGGGFSGLGTIASGVASFCFGLLIFRFNKTLRTYTERPCVPPQQAAFEGSGASV